MTTAERQEFGGYLRMLRQKARKSLRQVTREAGISAGYLSLIETGGREPPRGQFLKALAACYGVRVLDFLARAGYPVEETMVDEWPETVRGAILWHQEAAKVAIEARRALESAQEVALALRKFPLGTGTAAAVASELAPVKTALDLAELEVEKRHEWMCYVVSRERSKGW